MAAHEVDDRHRIEPGDRVLLVIENDVDFAQFLLETAREEGFKGIVTAFGAAGLALARDFKPAAITLDIRLPDIDGWRILAALKEDLATQHIPVFVMTTEDDRTRARELGAFDAIGKPVRTKETLQAAFRSIATLLARPERTLLVVGEDATERHEVAELVKAEGVDVREAASWKDALAAIDEQPIDCAVVTASLGDVPVTQVAERLAARRPLPFVAYAPHEWPRRQQARARKLAHVAGVTFVTSRERLLAQTARFLHKPVSDLGPQARLVMSSGAGTEDILTGKRVLIVDDDIRNIFAMTSVLEQHLMVVESAENGRDAIDLLGHHPGIDLVLMDIMMPEMDGYDTIRAIRQIPSFTDLPIVAVTAKAMKGDREKCIEAGAWDYLSKPIDSEQMLAVCRSWLKR